MKLKVQYNTIKNVQVLEIFDLKISDMTKKKTEEKDIFDVLVAQADICYKLILY